MGSKSRTVARTINLSEKRELGQFYTTNYSYILEGMNLPKNATLIEPFVGAGDLCLWAETKGYDSLDIECYDIAPPAKLKTKFVIKVRDTLLNPPSYDGKYVITNPPFLAKNKAKQTSYGVIFDKWETNDLYKCFLESIIDQDPVGGVVILPLNFFCDDRKVETRARFLERFTITRLNIFEEAVFSDTTYTVCAAQFEKREKKISNTVKVDAHIYPHRDKISLCLSKQTKWKVGAEVLEKRESKYKISRLVHTMVNDKSVRDKTLNPQKENKITNILLNCVDGGKMNSRIRMEWNPVPLLAKDTDRAFCTLVVDPPISEKKQKKLIDKFNKMLEDYREKYNSLFLVNYRNSSKSYARKRISFDIAFNLVKECLNKLDKKGNNNE